MSGLHTGRGVMRSNGDGITPFVPMASPASLPVIGAWMTWSPLSRRVLEALTQQLDRLPEPAFVRFGPGEYEYTLDLPVDHVETNLAEQVSALARGLHHLRFPIEPVFLNDLIRTDTDGRAVRVLFALVRGALVRLTGDTRSAIYAPLGADGGTEQDDFPLHADLYPPALLLNVFDRVPVDDTGATTLLRTAALRRTIETQRLPASPRDEILACLDQPADDDRYERFYDLLHGDYPWVEALEAALDRQALTVKLTRGQGYLVHDRRWLHGRTMPSGGVTPNRLYRLIFDTDETLARRRAALTP